MRIETGLFGLFVGLLGCVGEVENNVEVSRSDDFESFAETVPYDKASKTYTIEGDIALDEPALRRWHAAYETSNALVAVNREANKVRGPLKFCVSPDFGSTRNQEVRKAILAAGKEWEAVTGVRYEWNWLADLSCNVESTDVYFDVQPAPTDAIYVAKAFFPWNERAARTLFVNTSAWGRTDAITLTGLMRHELGHILGFRHEQVRPESPGNTGVCVDGGGDWFALTRFDKASVMAYPWCVNMVNKGDLLLTKWDKRGARCHYYGECEWERMPGAAKDITINSSGVVHVLGTNAVADGFGIHRWNPSASNYTSLNVGAISIADGNGTLYRVKSNHEIAMLTQAGWRSLPGAAVKIAAGANGEVWCLGTARVAGGYEVYRLVDGNWRYQNQGAESIAVAPDGWAWITTSTGAILGSTGQGNGWYPYGDVASGIGIGASGHIYRLAYGADQWNSHGYFIDENVDGSWQRLTGQAMRVGVDPSGIPWIVNNAREVYRNRWKREDVAGQ